MTATIDNYTRVLLTVIAILLSFITIALWTESPFEQPRAQAAIPDSGQQLNQILDAIHDMNQSVAAIQKLLVSGDVRVQVLPPVDKKTPPAKTKPSATPQN